MEDKFSKADDAARLAVMRESASFEGTDVSALETLMTYFKWISIEEGQELVHEGEPSDFAVLVVSGAFEILKSEEKGKHKLMGIAKAGTFLGELGMVTRKPRYATCRAVVFSEVGLLSRDEMNVMRAKDPELYHLMLLRLCEQLGKRLVGVTDAVMKLQKKNEIALSAAKQIIESVGL